MKDCTTCKYGYEDERLGIKMCHHPKRFSEDCVDFNMHEEVEESEKATGIEEKKLPEGLDEAAEEYAYNVDVTGNGGEDYQDDVRIAFKAGAEWQKSQMIRDCSVQASYEAEIEKAEERGYNLCKEQMLKDAVDGEIVNLMPDRNYVKVDREAIAKAVSVFKEGDQVKIVIVPEKEIEL